MNHNLRISANEDATIEWWCECSVVGTWGTTGETVVDLDELNKIAHDHIESYDRDTETDSVISGSRDYRAESLVTSDDVVTEPVELPEFWPRPFRS